MAGASALGGGGYTQLAGAAIGTGFNILGGFMGAGESERRRKEFERIANTSGLDFGSAMGESFDALDLYAPRYRRFAEDTVTTGADVARKGLERFMPGYGASVTEAQEEYRRMARGELPVEELDILAQRGAERGIGYGMPGSEFTGRLSLRDLGISGLQWRQAGLAGMQGLRQEAASITPRAPAVESVMQGAMPGNVISMRANERANRINMLLQAAGMPTSKDVWAQTFTNIGSQWSQAAANSGGGNTFNLTGAS